MSEATIAGAVASALEPAAAAAAAQLLEALHSEVSTELTRLEAAIPPRLEAAETDVRLWAEDMFTTFHKVVASIDAKRAGASTVPPTIVTTPTATAGSGAVNPLPNITLTPAATKPNA